MAEVIFRDRRAVQVENELLRLTVLYGGGHIAEIFDKRAGVSPLWIPRWKSQEPSEFSSGQMEEFGPGADARLLAGIMGHNLCLDIFGGPTPEEALAGLSVHGEASVGEYEISKSNDGMVARLTLQMAQLEFTRSIDLQSNWVRIKESTVNRLAIDRPIAWTQHVTLGPPFLDPTTTQFRASLTRSVVSQSDPGSDAYLSPGKEFSWPRAPRSDAGVADLRKMNNAAPASGYTAHLADPGLENSYFCAFAPRFRLAFGYVWRREDFPWLGIWEENCSRQNPPWCGREVTRGMEFGVSPFPETRREMVERGRMFDAPTYKWIPAHGRLEVEYWIVSQLADAIPEAVHWPGSEA